MHGLWATLCAAAAVAAMRSYEWRLCWGWMLYSIIVRETLNTHIPTLHTRFRRTLFFLDFRFCTLFALSLSNPFTTPFYVSVEVVFSSEDLVRC